MRGVLTSVRYCTCCSSFYYDSTLALVSCPPLNLYPEKVTFHGQEMCKRLLNVFIQTIDLTVPSGKKVRCLSDNCETSHWAFKRELQNCSGGKLHVERTNMNVKGYRTSFQCNKVLFLLLFSNQC